MSVAKKILMGSGAVDDYEIDQSLMFATGDTAYLHRTPGSAGNQRTWTWSGWVKRGQIDISGQPQTFFGVGAGSGTQSNSTFLWMGFYDKKVYVQDWDNNIKYVTNRYFRDPSAWYHFCIVVDTTDSTAGDRIKIFVNGVRETSFEFSVGPSEDHDTAINSTNQHRMGAVDRPTYDYRFDGYMAEVHFIDGTALTPTSFGETDSTTGQWIPKEAAGLTYGTNGFYCKFVSGALGTDSSGEGNNYTANNLANADVVYDTPTKNFPTWSPIDFRVDLANLALSQGNLKITSTTSNGKRYCTGIPATGKWYYEITFTAYTQSGTSYFQVFALNGSYIWHDTSSTGDRQIVASTGTTDDIPQFGTGDVLQIAIDMDNFKQWYGRNNTWITTSGTPDPAAGTGAADIFDAATISSSSNYTRRCPLLDFRGVASGAQNVFDINFGQRDFSYTPPTGFLSVNSQNWPDPTIKKPGDYFNPVIYTGDGTDDRTISGVGFQTELLWIKNRGTTNWHSINDSIRGVTKYWWTNDDDAEDTSSDALQAFTSDGFTIDDYADFANLNANTNTYVSWNWLAGTAPTADNSAGAGATPTAGSVKIDGSNLGSALAGTIAATRLTANTTSGFSIVLYEGTGSNATVAHGLSAAPELIIIKSLELDQNSIVYAGVSGVIDATDYVMLTDDRALTDDATIWNDTAPTSTVFSIGTSNNPNTDDSDYIAYCFHSVEGYSKVGSYEGNNNVDGPMVYCGFRPAWVMIKNVDQAESWNLLDNKRNAYNPVTLALWADLTSAGGAYGGSGAIDFLSNGFKLRATNGTINGSTNSWIFIAIAESPFKYANAR